MWKSVVFVPSAPVLVPDVAGADVPEVDAVRSAATAALRAADGVGATASSKWVVVGDYVGGHRDSSVSGTGTFAGFGVDRTVTLSDTAGSDTADPHWPTSMLLAGWYRESAQLGPLTPVLVDDAASVEQLAHSGASLAALVTQTPDPVSVMVVGDGATSLSPRAPGGGDSPQAHTLQGRIDAALGAADLDAVAGLSAADCARWGVGGRTAWQAVAAALAGVRVRGELQYAGAPLGVGYTVATWTVQE